MAQRSRQVIDPLVYADQVLSRTHRRIRWATIVTWVCLPVAVSLGVGEYLRLFGQLGLMDLIVLPLLALTSVGAVVGGLISGIFDSSPGSRVRPVETDPEGLREHLWELVVAQATLLTLALVLVVTWVLQLQHPSVHAPGYPYIALLPAAAFLSLAGAGAAHLFWRSNRLALREQEGY